ncbi:hypothetical protein B14911_04779 [Bacillus sp. NRRL B-14911]|uniref:Uncharacterized protein n=1 Tax=Bacillus infantis NRRL B-14911 TaxID=1367477 RepID=U5LHT7_9BACI|nr:hypothetical protein N288_21835 [Bacillus infantis NRRL B-14911]EAR65541.1 hypothetical protein B14911_04779 [Bacillus sp. NRRL B-14911]
MTPRQRTDEPCQFQQADCLKDKKRTNAYYSALFFLKRAFLFSGIKVRDAA